MALTLVANSARRLPRAWISRGVGGCACNTSIALARLDSALSVTALGRIGDDENGRYIGELVLQ